MACCHQPSPNSCSHHCHPPPPPPLDPLLLQSIASLLLHHYPPPPASAFHGSPRSPLALAHHCCSDHSDHHKRKDSPSPHHPPEPLSEPKCSVHSSLLQRMDLLESSFQQFSSPPSPDSALSLRDLAARRIQSRFRAFLVRRSRAFRRLQESLDSPSVSPRGTVEDGDETALNSKRLMLRAFAGFLELVEGNFVRENGVSSKTVKDIVPVSSDEKSPISCASEESEVVSHAKALTCNSRERVQTRLSEFFEDMFLAQDASKHCRAAGDESGKFRVAEEHNRLQSNAERRVRFIEDENATKVHKSDRDLTDSTIVVSRDVKKVENKVEKQQDDVEVNTDGEKNPVESVDGGKDEAENEIEETLNEDSESENEDCEEEEDEYETENEDCEEEEEDEYETENEGSENEVCEGEDESRDCRGAENATGNSTQQKAENQQDGEEVESDDSQSVEGSEDEYETETENEGSEVEYETETEVCDDDDDDEEEEEGEDVSEYEEETEYEEDEEEASEVENARESKIPQDNKINGNGEECYQCMTQKLCGEHNFVKKRDMSNVVCYICFKRGHMKRSCWYNPSRLCDKCHMIGHAQQVCGIVRKQQQLSQTSNC